MAQQSKVSEAKEMARESFSKMKGWFGDQKKKFDQRVTMEGILQQARESFEFFLESGIVEIEREITKKLMRDAYGIVFLTEVKGGAFVGGKIGTGIIITRIQDKEDEWSAPIAIGTGGISCGLQLGVSKVDHIIILPSPNHVKTFIGKGQLQIKGNAEAAAYKYGRDASIGVGVNDKGDAAPVISYSFGVKGLYGGISLSGGVLVPRNACNTNFYGKEIDLEQIIKGNVEAPKLNADYKKIISLINNNNVMNGKDFNGIHNENVGYEGNLNENEFGVNNSEYDQFNNQK